MNTNGVLSFNVSFTSPDGQALNFSDVISPPIIAPFWDELILIFALGEFMDLKVQGASPIVLSLMKEFLIKFSRKL